MLTLSLPLLLSLGLAIAASTSPVAAQLATLEEQLAATAGLYEAEHFGADPITKRGAQASAAVTLLKLPIADVPDDLLLGTLLSGSTKGNPVEVARRLLETADGHLFQLTRADIYRSTRGLGDVAHARILAAHELVRRSGARNLPNRITGAYAAWEYIRHLSEGPRERLSAIYLDNQSRVLGTRVLSEGSASYTIVDPAEVMRPALELRARAIILAHQHPGGSTEPSQPDIQVTERAAAAANVLGLQLLDHIIVTPDGYTSMAERGLMPARGMGIGGTW